MNAVSTATTAQQYQAVLRGVLELLKKVHNVRF
jgi:hypothetical protein